MTVQFYAVAGTISEDCAKFVTKSLRSVSVGAGLPAMTVYQWGISWLIHRYRRQASSHILVFMGHQIGLDAKGLYCGGELPAQYQQVFALATALANAQ